MDLNLSAGITLGKPTLRDCLKAKTALYCVCSIHRWMSSCIIQTTKVVLSRIETAKDKGVENRGMIFGLELWTVPDGSNSDEPKRSNCSFR